MRYARAGIPGAAIAVVLLATPVVAQDCAERLDGVSAQLAQLQLPPEVEESYRDLVRSAMRLEARDQERHCAAMAAGLEEALAALGASFPAEPASVRPQELELGELPPRPPTPEPEVDAARETVPTQEGDG